MTPVEMLVILNHEWIRAMARRYCKGMNAEDLASDTVLRCLSNAKRYDTTKSFKTWVATIMRNIHTNNVRHTSLHPLTPYFEEEHQRYIGADSLADIRGIFTAIRKLREKTVCMDTLIQYAKGYSYQEIAELSHLPIGTVKRRINEARRLLAEDIELKR